MSYRDLPDPALTSLRDEVARETARRDTLDQIRELGDGYVDAGHPYTDLVGIFPPPASQGFAVLAHMPEGRAQYWGAGYSTREWASGAFVYYPGPWGHSELKWDQYWEDITSRFPNGLDTVVSPKTVDVAALEDFCSRLPQGWRDKMVFAFYQEPEDNFTTPAQIDGFLGQVRVVAGVVRKHGIRNAVELQEWSLNPENRAYPSGEDNTARFVDPTLIDHVSWSVYEKNLKDRSEVMIGRIASFMGRWPQLTWDISATGVAVPVGTPQDDPRRVTRAQIAGNMITRARAHERCTGFGWFDFPAWGGNLDYGVDAPLRAVFAEQLGG